MILEFEITEREYKTYYKKSLINEIKKRAISLILIPLLIGFTYCGQPFNLTKFIEGTIISGLLYFAIFYITPYFTSIYRFHKTISEEPEYLEKKKINISEEGIYTETETKNITRKWESIVSVDSNDEFVSLQLADKRILLIPRRAFVSDSEMTDFMGIVQCEIIKRRGLHVTVKKKKFPYLWGVICFIPIVGVYVGIFFILLGILKYKDKWLTLIGVSGILFTYIILGSIFPEMWNEKVKNEKNTVEAQSYMKSLIKDIEFYKYQNGKYPKTLDELDNYSMYDPTQDSDSESQFFNYKLIGDKYLLFSSGIDKIRNTKDDIFPEISVSDSSKIGLLKYTCKSKPTLQSANKSTNR